MQPFCDDPCVLFSLRRESAPFRRIHRPYQEFWDAPCRTTFCGASGSGVVVMETGVGAPRVRRAVEWALSEPVFLDVVLVPRVVICAGFAGALSDELGVGDVFVPNAVVDSDGCRWPTMMRGSHGTLLTLPRMVGDPAEKRRLGEQYGAAAVDMESAAVARVCDEHGVPFGCVRVISDDVETALSPRLTTLLAGERVSPVRASAALLRSPALGVEFWRLARNTRFAARRLAAALSDLL